MDYTLQACNTKFVVTSGSGVLGATGQPIYLQGFYSSQVSAQGVALYSGSAAVTMALLTLAPRGFVPFPMACPGGLTFQTVGNPGDGALSLVFFWIPG